MAKVRKDSQWTVDTLHEFIQRLLAEHDARHMRSRAEQRELHEEQRRGLDIAVQSVERLLSAAVESSKEAIRKVEANTDRRFESMNEFRSSLVHQQSLLISRAEVEAMHSRHTADLKDLRDRINTTTGRGVGLNEGWVRLVAAIGAVGAMVGAASALVAIFETFTRAAH